MSEEEREIITQYCKDNSLNRNEWAKRILLQAAGKEIEDATKGA